MICGPASLLCLFRLEKLSGRPAPHVEKKRAAPAWLNRFSSPLILVPPGTNHPRRAESPEKPKQKPKPEFDAAALDAPGLVRSPSLPRLCASARLDGCALPPRFGS